MPLEVTQYVARPRHGGFAVLGCKEYGPGAGTFFSRTFVCVCGEQLRDEDQIDGVIQDRTGQLVHENCAPSWWAAYHEERRAEIRRELERADAMPEEERLRRYGTEGVKLLKQRLAELS